MQPYNLDWKRDGTMELVDTILETMKYCECSGSNEGEDIPIEQLFVCDDQMYRLPGANIIRMGRLEFYAFLREDKFYVPVDSFFRIVGSKIKTMFDNIMKTKLLKYHSLTSYEIQLLVQKQNFSPSESSRHMIHLVDIQEISHLLLMTCPYNLIVKMLAFSIPCHRVLGSQVSCANCGQPKRNSNEDKMYVPLAQRGEHFNKIGVTIGTMKIDHAEFTAFELNGKIYLSFKEIARHKIMSLPALQKRMKKISSGPVIAPKGIEEYLFRISSVATNTLWIDTISLRCTVCMCRLVGRRGLVQQIAKGEFNYSPEYNILCEDTSKIEKVFEMCPKKLEIVECSRMVEMANTHLPFIIASSRRRNASKAACCKMGNVTYIGELDKDMEETVGDHVKETDVHVEEIGSNVGVACPQGTKEEATTYLDDSVTNIYNEMQTTDRPRMLKKYQHVKDVISNASDGKSESKTSKSSISSKRKSKGRTNPHEHLHSINEIEILQPNDYIVSDYELFCEKLDTGQIIKLDGSNKVVGLQSEHNQAASALECLNENDHKALTTEYDGHLYGISNSYIEDINTEEMEVGGEVIVNNRSLGDDVCNMIGKCEVSTTELSKKQLTGAGNENKQIISDVLNTRDTSMSPVKQKKRKLSRCTDNSIHVERKHIYNQYEQDMHEPTQSDSHTGDMTEHETSSSNNDSTEISENHSPCLKMNCDIPALETYSIAVDHRTKVTSPVTNSVRTGSQNIKRAANIVCNTHEAYNAMCSTWNPRLSLHICRTQNDGDDVHLAMKNDMAKTTVEACAIINDVDSSDGIGRLKTTIGAVKEAGHCKELNTRENKLCSDLKSEVPSENRFDSSNQNTTILKRNDKLQLNIKNVSGEKTILDSHINGKPDSSLVALMPCCKSKDEKGNELGYKKNVSKLMHMYASQAEEKGIILGCEKNVSNLIDIYESQACFVNNSSALMKDDQDTCDMSDEYEEACGTSNKACLNAVEQLQPTGMHEVYYECEMCGIIITELDCFNEHMNIHTKGQQYKQHIFLLNESRPNSQQSASPNQTETQQVTHAETVIDEELVISSEEINKAKQEVKAVEIAIETKENLNETDKNIKSQEMGIVDENDQVIIDVRLKHENTVSVNNTETLVANETYIESQHSTATMQVEVKTGDQDDYEELEMESHDRPDQCLEEMRKEMEINIKKYIVFLYMKKGRPPGFRVKKFKEGAEHIFPGRSFFINLLPYVLIYFNDSSSLN